MANFDAQPVNTGTSTAFEFTSQLRVAAPFTESNMTWVEVENSTAADWAGFNIAIVTTPNVSVAAGIFFVAKGAAASEVMVAAVPNTMDYKSNTMSIYVPVPIPSGTRLSVSATSEVAQIIYGQIIGVLSANFDAEPTFTVYETGPYDLSNTATYGLWPSVDSGSSSNTKGSYTEISFTSHTNNVLNGDSLANTYDYFGVLPNGNFNTAQANYNFLLDMATGAAASEVIYAGDIFIRSTANEKDNHHIPIESPSTVATSGTRISARTQCSGANATDRLRGVLLYGVR